MTTNAMHIEIPGFLCIERLQIDFKNKCGISASYSGPKYSFISAFDVPNLSWIGDICLGVYILECLSLIHDSSYTILCALQNTAISQIAIIKCNYLMIVIEEIHMYY